MTVTLILLFLALPDRCANFTLTILIDTLVAHSVSGFGGGVLDNRTQLRQSSRDPKFRRDAVIDKGKNINQLHAINSGKRLLGALLQLPRFSHVIVKTVELSISISYHMHGSGAQSVSDHGVTSRACCM